MEQVTNEEEVLSVFNRSAFTIGTVIDVFLRRWGNKVICEYGVFTGIIVLKWNCNATTEFAFESKVPCSLIVHSRGVILKAEESYIIADLEYI